ncbi:MAG: hypothetical protein ACI959_002107 [Limisphaerales bacterium]|jgi:hypothetical protein
MMKSCNMTRLLTLESVKQKSLINPHKTLVHQTVVNQTQVNQTKTMSKLDDLVTSYQEENKKHNLGLTKDLIEKVARAMGPTIYRADAAKVSGTDPKELATVKKNFLMKKLGLEDGPKLDDAIANCMEKMGKSNRNKYRVLVYALLAKHFKKTDIYG